MSFGDTPFIQREPSRQLTTTITNSNWEEAKRNIIPFTEALAFGIRFLVAEKEGDGHPANSYENKIQKLQAKLDEISQELWDLKDKYEPEEETKKEEVPKLSKEEIEAEADKFLK